MKNKIIPILSSLLMFSIVVYAQDSEKFCSSIKEIVAKMRSKGEAMKLVGEQRRNGLLTHSHQAKQHIFSPEYTTISVSDYSGTGTFTEYIVMNAEYPVAEQIYNEYKKITENCFPQKPKEEKLEDGELKAGFYSYMKYPEVEIELRSNLMGSIVAEKKLYNVFFKISKVYNESQGERK